MIRNWKYYEAPDPCNDLYINQGQYMAGSIMGVLMAPVPMQCQEGHLGNAKSFDYPVRYEVIEHLYDSKEAAREEIEKKIKKLEIEGCRFIITSGQEFGLFHDVIVNATDLLALSTTLLSVLSASASINRSARVCVVNQMDVETNLSILHQIGLDDSVIAKCVFSDERLLQVVTSKKEELDINDVMIGAYIWDWAEPCKIADQNEVSQIYTPVKLAGLLKKAVTQKEYSGFL